MNEHGSTMNALQRLGIVVTQNERMNGSWGWSMQNEKLTRPWVGGYPTAADATAAALDWVLEHAWRGVLFPILQALSSVDEPSEASSTDDWDVDSESAQGLLTPWLHAFDHQARS